MVIEIADDILRISHDNMLEVLKAHQLDKTALAGFFEYMRRGNLSLMDEEFHLGQVPLVSNHMADHPWLGPVMQAMVALPHGKEASHGR